MEENSGQVDNKTQNDESVESLRMELNKVIEESKTFQDKFLRQAADLENFRRRTEREKSDLLRFANEGLIKDLVPVLDSFNQATDSLAGNEPESNSILDGLAMVREQLLNVLRKHGLEVIMAEGSKFDPNLHQAIQRIEVDGAESEVVAQEFAKGYLLNGRLVRPAMVSVNVPAK